MRKRESLLIEEIPGRRERNEGRVVVIGVVYDEPGLVKSPRGLSGLGVVLEDGEEVLERCGHWEWGGQSFFLSVDERGMLRKERTEVAVSPFLASIVVAADSERGFRRGFGEGFHHVAAECDGVLLRG